MNIKLVYIALKQTAKEAFNTMDYLGERIAYLRGLAEGLNIDKNTSEGKMIHEIVNVLSDFAEVINDLDDSQIQMGEQLEEIDEDLAKVESEVFDVDDYDDDYEESTYYEIQCPNCRETVYLDEDLFEDEDEILCPNCKEPIEIEFECDCCHHDEYDEEDEYDDEYDYDEEDNSSDN